MYSVLKKLKVWTLYVHIVAQVNHIGLGVKIETNCLRDSDLIPRHSFMSTTISIFINGVLKFMCVFVCSLVADKANVSSELSKYKQSKSILKVMTLVMSWLGDIFNLKPKPTAISVLFYKLRSSRISFKTFFLYPATQKVAGVLYPPKILKFRVSVRQRFVSGL